MDAAENGADSAPLRPCRAPGREQRASGPGSVDYTVRYLPIRFVCETGTATAMSPTPSPTT
jgi:hypothetical protein